jgi:uncharacterized membrane protein
MLAVLAPIQLAALVAIVVLWPSGEAATRESGFAAVTEDHERGMVRGTVADVCPGSGLDRLPDGSIPDEVLCASARVELTSGADRGAVVEVPVPPQVFRSGVPDGTRVTVARFPVDEAESSRSAGVAPSGSLYGWVDFDRSVPLLVMALVFALLVVAVGRLRGLASLVGLGVAYLAVAFFIIPALREGANPVAVAVSSAVLIMTVVLYLAHGFSTRTTAALLGTVFGVVVAAALAAWASGAARLNGLTDEESYVLSALTTGEDLSGIILCGLVLAGLGVLNDVTITQVSAVWEIREHAPRMSTAGLFRSGMRVGRDHLASTVYTIAFAYAGAALPTLLLIDLYNQPIVQVLTSGLIVEEVARTAVGAVGLILAIPVTTAIAALAVTSAAPADQPRSAISHGEA